MPRLRHDQSRIRPTPSFPEDGARRIQARRAGQATDVDFRRRPRICLEPLGEVPHLPLRSSCWTRGLAEYGEVGTTDGFRDVLEVLPSCLRIVKVAGLDHNHL